MGAFKECCDCCLLAKELLHKNQPCVAATGFSASCLKSFTRCCQGPLEITQTFPHVTAQRNNFRFQFPLTHFLFRVDRPSGPVLDNSTVYFGDRCANSKCDHLCNDRGGETVECSCRSGYDLAPDGYTCVDRNECRSSTPPCIWGREVCVNVAGGYLCERLTPLRFRHRPSLDKTRFIRMREGSSRAVTSRMESLISLSTMLPRRSRENVQRCPLGWQFKNGQCIDIDECLVLADDCLESQRCLNLPGTFKCIRTLSCGTGYAMDSETEDCIDVDECSLGSHDCGPLYQCRNTQGSYRCDPKKCAEGELQNPRTGECISIDCPLGYYPANGMCHDVDECATGNRCAVGEECVNTAGSFRCEEKGNICASGYAVNENTGFCDDINECLDESICDGLMCINMPGSYKCRCNAGYEFNEKTKRCEDVDECEKFAGHVCDLSAECQNTIGSFICKCKNGFELAADGRRCEGIDGRTCEDIDECTLWAGSDVDECALGECQGRDRICVNTLGHFKCHHIECPRNYVRDICDGLSDSLCKSRYPIHITWQYIAIPKGIAITSHRPTITLFTIKGPAHNDSVVQFELNLKRTVPESPLVLLAIRSNFLLQKGKERNSAVVAVRDTLDGPQTIEMELVLRLTKKSQFTGKYVANLVVHVAAHKRNTNFFGY
ncbi:unnamed protein product [Angiostrongylus costaricensis]|uniref:Fibulin-1 n=1 Tax=Angiostrongylus costaricensis TaxID=334426 RepID=A0A158PFV0_ANGCS|nr:unnamed protein product [Angiostrongylus costaricensis]